MCSSDLASADFRDAVDATLSAARDLGGGADAAAQDAWVTIGLIE